MWKCSYEDIVVDYTGGTKAMSAALVLATIDTCNSYSYIGGGPESKDARTKEGLGVVIDGKEKYIYQQNPWDSLGIGELKVIDNLFSKARYASAVEELNKIKDSVDSRLKDVYSLLGNICEAYYCWDVFKIKEANNLFNRSFKNLSRYSVCGNKYLDNLIDAIDNNMKWLEELWTNIAKSSDKPSSKAYILFSKDLIANAIRRAEREHKFEDAVARLYSSIEKLAKGMLLEYGIDNSCTREDQIPVQLQDKFKKYSYYDSKTNSKLYRYGFEASCELLSLCNSEFGARYSKQKREMEKLMNIRNSSVLAHGMIPVTEDTYKKLLDATLEFAGYTRNDLVEFPELNLDKWGPMILRS